MGLPVRYVELGNEFYLSTSDYEERFPNATSYGQTVAYFVSGLHADFARVVVAAVGAFHQGTSREQSWNQAMLTAAAAAHGLPDAVTLHVYPQWTKPLRRSDLRAFFAQGYSTLSAINGVVHGFPDPKPVWVTEYNLYPQVTASTHRSRPVEVPRSTPTHTPCLSPSRNCCCKESQEWHLSIIGRRLGTRQQERTPAGPPTRF